MEEIIYKYLNKTLTPEENEQLKNWLASREENKIILTKLSSFYRNDESRLPISKEIVWDEIHQRLERSTASATPTIRMSWRMVSRIAAVLVIVSTLVTIAYLYSFETKKVEPLVNNTIFKETPLGSKVTTKLPDGSLVTLNSGSKISFSEEFDENKREVHLTGEAFFEVVHNLNKPFLVRMDGDVVRVLGTSFNIRSYPEDSAVYVSVATGRVSYSIPSGDEVILEPNRMATYLPHRRSLTTGEVNDLQAFGWKDKVLYFNDITFDKVVTELERWYGIQIIYSNEQAFEGSYSEQFDNPTLAEVLHSLSFVYRFEFEIDGKKVILIKTTT